MCYAKHGDGLRNIRKSVTFLPTYEISIAHEELNDIQLRRWMYVAYHAITLSESEECQLNLWQNYIFIGKNDKTSWMYLFLSWLLYLKDLRLKTPYRIVGVWWSVSLHSQKFMSSLCILCGHLGCFCVLFIPCDETLGEHLRLS